MPVASADLSETSGMLSVSSTNIQGAAILEIVVNDPDISDTTVDINSGATVTVLGTSYDMVQAVNGKWYAYVVDNSVATLLDADSTGLEFGIKCTAGLGTGLSASIIPSGTSVWAEVIAGQNGATDSGSCLDADNMVSSIGGTAVVETSASSARQQMSAAVLQSAPSLSNHNDKTSTDSGYDLGQRLHNLNSSGFGTWPYIYSIELSGSNIVEYGSDSISVSFGNTDGEASIGLVNPTVASDTQLHLYLADPALNIDPTTADIWTFDLDQSTTIIFANNGTNNTISLEEQAQMGCIDNCQLTVDDASTAPGQLVGYDDVTMTESGANTGVFESWNADGDSEIYTITAATADKQHTFKYGGNSVDVIIAYNDATITMTHGSGDWETGVDATITIVDPDLNTNPGSAETLSIGNSSSVIPTIIVGSPLTLTGGGQTNTNLQAGDGEAIGVCNSGYAQLGLVSGTGNDCKSIIIVGEDAGSEKYSLNIQNTTDNSQRLRIIHYAADDGIGGTTHTDTWINVTTGHTRSALVNLPGTVVLSYDVSGPAAQLESTAIAVYVTDSGNNGTDNTAGDLALLITGNSRSGVLDLDDAAQHIKSADITATNNFGSPQNNGTEFITVAFQITHAAGTYLSATEDYAIAADFCNFDQNNGSLTHN